VVFRLSSRERSLCTVIKPTSWYVSQWLLHLIGDVSCCITADAVTVMNFSIDHCCPTDHHIATYSTP
jgi:hypothetical protein